MRNVTFISACVRTESYIVLIHGVTVASNTCTWDAWDAGINPCWFGVRTFGVSRDRPPDARRDVAIRLFAPRSYQRRRRHHGSTCSTMRCARRSPCARSALARPRSTARAMRSRHVCVVAVLGFFCRDDAIARVLTADCVSPRPHHRLTNTSKSCGRRNNPMFFVSSSVSACGSTANCHPSAA